jgi:hypothetical protein
LKLLEKKRAVTNQLVEDGNKIEEYLTSIMLESTAQVIVAHILSILNDNDAFYAFGAGKYREETEAWNRCLFIIFKENGANIKELELKD